MVTKFLKLIRKPSVHITGSKYAYRFQKWSLETMENFFYKYGKLVARYIKFDINLMFTVYLDIAASPPAAHIIHVCEPNPYHIS